MQIIPSQIPAPNNTPDGDSTDLLANMQKQQPPNQVANKFDSLLMASSNQSNNNTQQRQQQPPERSIRRQTFATQQQAKQTRGQEAPPPREQRKFQQALKAPSERPAPQRKPITRQVSQDSPQKDREFSRPMSNHQPIKGPKTGPNDRLDQLSKNQEQVEPLDQVIDQTHAEAHVEVTPANTQAGEAMNLTQTAFPQPLVTNPMIPVDTQKILALPKDLNTQPTDQQIKALKSTFAGPQLVQASVPAVALLTGQLEHIEPNSIPKLVTGNNFIRQAIEHYDVQEFMNQPLTIRQIFEALDFNEGVMKLGEQIGINLDATTTPKEFFGAMGLDPQQIAAEFQVLKSNLTLEGVKPYMERAKILRQQAGIQPMENLEVQQSISDDNPLETLTRSPEKPTTPLATQQILQSSPVSPQSLSQHQTIANHEQQGNMIRQTQGNQPINPTPAVTTVAAAQVTNQDPFEQIRAAMGKDVAVNHAPQKPMANPVTSNSVMDRLMATQNAQTPQMPQSNNMTNAGQQQQTQQIQTPQQLGFSQTIPAHNQLHSTLTQNFSAVDQTQPSVSNMITNSTPNQSEAPVSSSQQNMVNQLANPTPKQELNMMQKSMDQNPMQTQTAQLQNANQLGLTSKPTMGPSINNLQVLTAEAAMSADQPMEPQAEPRAEAPQQPVQAMGTSFQQSRGGDQQGQPHKFFSPQQHWNTLDSLRTVSPHSSIRPQFETTLTSNSNRIEVIEQIMKKASLMVRDGGGSARIKLDTSDHGHLDLALKMNDKNLDLRILAESDKVRESLMSEIPKMRELLVHQGLNLDTIEIGVAGEQLKKESFGSHNPWAQNQSSQNKGQESSQGQGQGHMNQQNHRPIPKAFARAPKTHHSGQIQVFA